MGNALGQKAPGKDQGLQVALSKQGLLLCCSPVGFPLLGWEHQEGGRAAGTPLGCLKGEQGS